MFTNPNDFAGRPYCYLLNQSGHFLLGFFAVTTYVWVMYVATGIYIDQVAAWAVVAVFYFMAFELVVQGWRGEDTLQDTFFVTLGGSAWAFIDMSQVIHRLMLAEMVLMIFLALGTLREIKRGR